MIALFNHSPHRRVALGEAKGLAATLARAVGKIVRCAQNDIA
jgi:hypothetical protein